MKRILFLSVIFIGLLYNFVYSSEIENSRYIVKLNSEYKGRMYSQEEIIDNKFIVVENKEDAEYFIENGMAEYIEPDYKLELYDISSEPYYSNQYYISNTYGEYAVNNEYLGKGITIGVIDSGCFEHEDIINNLSDGYNYIDNNYDTADEEGHGTHVSGIIAAQLNGIGIAGIASESKIVPLKCFNSHTSGTISDAIRAIYDAVDIYNCDIINMSWGSRFYSAALEEAINYANSKGVIMVAAAGNNGSSDISYPAGYDNVIGVAAIDGNNNITNFSQHNSSVFISAPGKDIFSLGLNNSYISFSGTSQAAPMVTGLIAIIKGIDNNLNTNDIKNILINSSTDLGSKGYDYYYGYGSINIEKAVKSIVSNENEKLCSITYEANNGSGDMIIEMISEGEEIILSDAMFNPQKNYKFKGWNIDGIEYAPGDKYTVNYDTIIYAIWQEDYLYPPKFTVKGVVGGRSVTFKSDSPGAIIYYTKENRSQLKLTDPRVSNGRNIIFDAYYGTIYARAYKDGKWSNPARLILKIPKVNDPTITKNGNKIIIKSTTTNSLIYYTTDGTLPSPTNYTGKFWNNMVISIPKNKTIKAIAVRSCFSNSNIVTGVS